MTLATPVSNKLKNEIKHLEGETFLGRGRLVYIKHKYNILATTRELDVSRFINTEIYVCTYFATASRNCPIGGVLIQQFQAPTYCLICLTTVV